MQGEGAPDPLLRGRHCGCGNGARARRESLAGTAFPHADRELVRSVDADELDIRACREAWMPLDERPEPTHLPALGLATDDRVWISDRHRRELDALVVGLERLALPHF